RPAALPPSSASEPLSLHDALQVLEIKDASVVVLCLTLQFIRPIYREKLLGKIADGLVPGGALILVEKVITENSEFNRAFIKHYRSEEHTSELQSREKLVCRLLLEK